RVVGRGDDEDPAVNQTVYEEANRAGILVNVVDTPEFCNFISPAVVRRGPLAIAISTGGRSPALAKRVREELEEVFPAEFADYLDDLVDLRTLLRDRIATPAGRETAWRELMAAGLLDLLRDGQVSVARGLALAAADRVAAAGGRPS
ncbi:MAG TPA: NAD(P)-dependent oxidoreductase, partial [Dehalococcoidia bacterium]|nr:NAD(P)-dependent oxidoreductase [Dehalococcoidia bacterium]